MKGEEKRGSITKSVGENSPEPRMDGYFSSSIDAECSRCAGALKGLRALKSLLREVLIPPRL